MANVLTKYTWPWAVVATVLVVGFMYWLHAESSELGTGMVAADSVSEGPELIADTTFVKDPTRFSRQRILLSPVKVTQWIGRATIAAQVDGLENYPLILDRVILEKVETEMRVMGGDNLAVAGQVYALNDSILDVYVQRGFFEPENRALVEGSTTFFLVDSLDFVFPEDVTGGGGTVGQ
ncbi:MAG TPA: hypothetical protein VLC48_07510 [Gemmatimonadota bacterium]|nr:hypothetical protein [Gemmatimonadota bacterium]